MRSGRHSWLIVHLAFFILLVACGQDKNQEPTRIIAPTPTQTTVPTTPGEDPASVTDDINFITIATDAPSRFQDFTDIDGFGNVVGFDADIMANLAAKAEFEYEFVVTSFNGLLDSVANGEFDMAMSALIIPNQPPTGLFYTDPYLEVGQVLVVRANETEFLSYKDITVGIPIGVQRFTSGEQTARLVAGLTEPDLQIYDSTPEAIQALIDREVEGVIIDSDDAEHYTLSYSQQLKITDGVGQAAWITQKSYGMAVPIENQILLTTLNEAIAQTQEDGTVEHLTRAWLVPEETINAGESLVGTPANELVIGVAGSLTGLDPAARDPDLISWEIEINTMGGLLMLDEQNQLVPVLASDYPEISEDKLEYTFSLRPGLTFPDSGEFTANDVKYSISRAAGLGNFQVNRYLKDEDGDNFADADAVQIIDPLTVKIVLKNPTSTFLSVLATPPFFIVSQECFSINPDPTSTCGGIGPYTITEWEPDVQMRLKANPRWPGPAAEFENIQLRFYDGPGRMLRSLENSAIDIAWTGLSVTGMSEMLDRPEFTYWEGTSAFKSYLVFEQGQSPWDKVTLRQAVAYSVDRQALGEDIFKGDRKGLYSPLPDGTPGQVNTEPVRDLPAARALLTAEGYSPDRKLEFTIWYVSDGRYTVREESYARALEEQLEETGMIEVTLEGSPWQVFRPQSLTCNYPTYLLGWPSPGQPVSYPDAMSWLEYFITNTDGVCSNYESLTMDSLYEQAQGEIDEASRLDIYRQIQELWARDLPTLDLTQKPQVALSLNNVQGVAIDALGLLHYDALTKRGG